MEQRYRLHSVVLARPFAKAVALAALGAALAALGWPAIAAGGVLVALGALVAVRAVWRWERTELVVTGDRLTVVRGTLRRRSMSAHLGAVEVEQGLLGRLLGFGTVVAGDVEITYVPATSFKMYTASR